MSKIKIREAVIVEGRYDKIRLGSLIDGLIITTEGFGIFKNQEKMNMLRHLAETRGLLILTDSDGAGFVIRNHLKACIAPQYIKHAYIPDILGKERRKTVSSKEGKLGVEGMSTEVLLHALEKAGVLCETGEASSPETGNARITRADFFRAGLSGGENSAARRKALLHELGLPERMTTNALLDVINDYMSPAQFRHFVTKLSIHQEE